MLLSNFVFVISLRKVEYFFYPNLQSKQIIIDTDQIMNCPAMKALV